MTKPLKYILLFLCFSLLILIRFFEHDLFYDPYLKFFENDYLYMDNPRREVFKLTSHTVLRYVLNTVISLAVLYVFFEDNSMIKFSSFVYLAAFLILLTLYLYFVVNPKQEDYYLFFIMRRFLIQPVILIVLLPAFYYHKLKN